MTTGTPHVYPVLLAGGSGTRLWPVSRELYPKQIAKFIGKQSLIQSTLLRVIPPLAAANVRVVCGEAHRHEIARHMQAIGIPGTGKILCEPVGRNTAPAILLACLEIRHAQPDAILAIFPADHVIGDTSAFHERLTAALKLAAEGHIVTFGITPHYPETGYGYVEGGDPAGHSALRIRRFVEKPDLETARGYVASGNFFWNSGMFAFRASVIIEEFGHYHPQMLASLHAAFQPGQPIAREDYLKLPELSIDYAIMEKTARGVVLPSTFGWSDIGSWKSLYDFLPKNADGNVLGGDVIARDTRNCLVFGYERLIAVNRLQDTVVVETPDSIFVSDLEHSLEVKSIVSELKQRGRREYQEHRTRRHHWGAEALLEEAPHYRTARLEIDPGGEGLLRLTDGYDTHLIALSGAGEVEYDCSRHLLRGGDSLRVPGGCELRLRNPGGGQWELIRVDTRSASARASGGKMAAG